MSVYSVSGPVLKSSHVLIKYHPPNSPMKSILLGASCFCLSFWFFFEEMNFREGKQLGFWSKFRALNYQDHRLIKEQKGKLCDSRKLWWVRTPTGNSEVQHSIIICINHSRNTHPPSRFRICSPTVVCDTETRIHDIFVTLSNFTWWPFWVAH